MESKIKHTNNKNLFQCSHNNRGFCKFRQECRYQHFHELCSKTICKDRECRFRHPKNCKNGDNCKFNKKKICAYRHNAQNSEEVLKNVNLIKKIKAAEDEIEMLKAEICELRVNVKMKETQLKETIGEQSTSLTKLKEENKDMKGMIDNYKNTTNDDHAKFEQLKRENQDLRKQNSDQDFRIKSLNLKLMDYDSKLNAQLVNVKNKNKEIQIQNDTIKGKNDEISKLKADLKCDKCEFISENLSSLVRKTPTKKRNSVLQKL